MTINSISSAYSTSTTSSISSVSSLLTTYHDEVVTGDQSSFGYTQDSVQISSAGQASVGQTPPDFNSMSTDDFRDHLLEMQATLEAAGYSSDLDISSLSDDELNSIKDDMASRGKGGNPPPPPPPSGTESSSSTSYTDELLESLLESLNSAEDETSYQTIEQMLSLYAQLG